MKTAKTPITPQVFCMNENGEDFKRFYSKVNEDIGLVSDVGHANINGQIESFLTAFADKIVHMHVHDNHGKRTDI